MRNSTAPYNATAPLTWGSPVTFLLGGVGSMMALIVFAVIILACSYVRDSDSNHPEENNRSEQRRESDAEYGDKNETMKNIRSSEGPEERPEKVVVIMAGDVTPTFMANPSSVSAI